MSHYESMNQKEVQELIEKNCDLVPKTIKNYQKKLNEANFSWMEQIDPALATNPEFQKFLLEQRKKYKFKINQDELQDCYLVLVESLIRYQNKERYLMRAYTKRNLFQKLEEIKEQQDNKLEVQKDEKSNYQLWFDNCQYSNKKKEQQRELQKLVYLFLEHSNLSEREKLVLIDRYGLQGKNPQSRKKIAEKYFVDDARTIQIEQRTLRKLKLHKEIFGFTNFLDYPQKVKKKNYR